MSIFDIFKSKKKPTSKLNQGNPSEADVTDFELYPDSIRDTIATGSNIEVQDMYDKLIKVDGHFAGKIQDRLAITKAAIFNWEAASDSAEDQEILDFVKPIVENVLTSEIITHLLKAPIHRMAGGEIMWGVVDGKFIPTDIETLPFRNFEINKNTNNTELQKGKLRLVLYNYDTHEYSEMPPCKVIHTETPLKLDTTLVSVTDTIALIILAKYYALLKHWPRFLERYGNPPVLAHTSNIPDKDRDELLDALSDFAANAYGVIQNVDKLEILEPKSDGSAKFKTLIDLADNYISVALTGQSGTSGDGSKSSLASLRVLDMVGKRVIHSSFINLETAIIDQLIAPIVFFNYGNKELPKYHINPPEDLIEKVKLDKELYGIGIRFVKDYFVKVYHMNEEDFELAEEKTEPGQEEQQLDEEGNIIEENPINAMKRDIFAKWEEQLN